MQKQLFSIKGGSYETKISQKKAKKLNRVKNFSLVTGLILAVFAVAPVVPTALTALATGGSYEATGGRDADDPYLWTYEVTGINDPQDISHLDIQLDCFTDNLSSVVDDIEKTQGQDGVITSGDNSTTPPVSGDIIKWDELNGTSATISFTLNDIYPEINDGAQIIVKSGVNTGTVIIDVPGPDCTPAPEPATLTVIKNVINDNGGTKDASDFTMEVNGTNVSDDEFPGSEVGVTVTLDAGSYSVDEADTLGYSKLVGIDCSGTIAAGEHKTCTIINDDPFVPDPLGSITVCKVIIDHENNVITGPSSPSAEFEISGFTPDPVTSVGAPAGEIPTSTFTTPISFNADLLSSHAGDDAECVKYDDLAIGSYYYDEEVYPSAGWETPLYNDQFDTSRSVNTVADFYEYSGELFDGNVGNDDDRDKNVDGHITLNDSRPDRTLVVLNQTKAPVPDPEAELTLVKQVVNDDGGTELPTAWTLEADGPTDITGTTGDASVTDATVDPGTYTLSESGPAGYTASEWSCSVNGGTAVDGNSVTLADGDDAVCTIVNDDDPAPTGTLTLVKTVVNDNGGTLTKNDFQAYIDGNSTDWDTAVILTPGSHQASEDVAIGYSASDWGGDCDINGNVIVVAGENKTCTITNDDIAPTLTLVKTVVNDDGGVLTEDDFQAQIDGNNVDWSLPVSLNAGDHTASEITVAGYTASDWGGDCDVNGEVALALAENKTCTITNNDTPSTLTLIKTVINDNGGTAVADDFQAKIDGTDVAWNVAVPLGVGDHTASEAVIAGYTAGDWGGDCDADGNVTMVAGEDKTCTITNDDNPPTTGTLTLVKTVINDNGRNATEADFQGQIDGTDVPWDVAQTLAPDTYTVSEIMNVSNYTQESIICDNGDTGGPVTLAGGEDVTCTITNNDRPRTSSGSPTLTIDKTVTPTITDPGTTVNYTIVVSNVGNRTAINVVLDDVLPAGFTYTATGLGTQSWSLGNMGSGDSQTITYEVDVDSAVLPGDYVNVAETSADNHGPVSDDATVTVRGVLGEGFEPVLEITKVGDREIINPGGQINYTVTITNVGEAPAINLVVTDTLPEGFTSADTGLGVITWNVDRLDVGDTWDVSFLVNISEDIETQPLDEDTEGEQETGTYINEVRANAENYDGELFASYTVAARGEVLGETGAGISDIVMWLLAILTLAGSGILFKRELSLARN